LKMRKTIITIPIVHLLMYIAIGLNIPILRQTIVFIYLLFIPGFVLLRILRLKKLNLVDTILFSVGLSIAFLMFIGLLINELYPILGISQPLSTIPLTITLSSLTLILFFVGYRQDLLGNWNSSGRHWIELKSIAPKSLLLVFPVILSIIGALYVNIPFLLLMVIIIAALYVLSVSSTRLIPAKLYPLMIFAISIALVFHMSLISKYIMGHDAPLEYYVFKLTEIGGHWRPLDIGINPMGTVNFNSMLSITILPTIYSVLLNIKGEIIFKVFYPLVFSLVPLALYRIYERQIGKLAALLSALFFICSPIVFYGVSPLSLNRQIVGALFFVLSIFLLLDKRISTKKRRLLLIIFGAALVVSHYSLTYLYLTYVVFAFAISRIKGDSDKVLNGAMVLLLFCTAFSWYTYVFPPLRSLADFFQEMFSKFTTDLFNPAARSSDIFRPHPILTVASIINWALFVTAHFFIVIGIFRLILRPKKIGFDPKYRMMAVLATIILFLCVVAPNFAPSLNFERFYAITLLFLAPCFVLGGKTFFSLSKNAWKRAKGQHNSGNAHGHIVTLLIAIVLSAYFLSQSGFVNRITGGAPHSYSFDLNRLETSNDLGVRISLHDVYIPEQDVFSAFWLSKNVGEASTLYADLASRNVVLTSYGLISRERIRLLTNTTMLEQGAYIYLRHLNIVDGVITTWGAPFNTSEISSLLSESNKIYSNGDSEAYCPQG